MSGNGHDKERRCEACGSQSHGNLQCVDWVATERNALRRRLRGTVSVERWVLACYVFGTSVFVVDAWSRWL